MNIVQTSMRTDSRASSSNYYAQITIKNGKIVLIEVEEGREGGVFWSPDFNANGNLRNCMRSVARSWPNLYRKVRRCCRQSNKLPSIGVIKHNDLLETILNLEKDIATLTTKLARKKAKLKTKKIKNGSKTTK